MAASIDPNVWYGISETRVDNGTKPLDNTLQTIPDGSMRVWNGQNMWQFQPVDGAKDQYLLRALGTSVLQQLATCYSTDEIHPGRTRACMMRTTSDDSQKWMITRWNRSDGINSWKIQNVGNGTGYALDVHPGNAVFLNSEIEGETVNGQKVGSQVAQHWVFSSRKAVDDGAFSTIYSNTPSPAAATGTQTSAGATPSSTSSGGPNNASATPTSGASTPQEPTAGLSAGAAAGIGVGATIAVLALIGAVAFFFWRRRQAARRGDIGTESLNAAGPDNYKPASAGRTFQQQQYHGQGHYQHPEDHTKSDSPFTTYAQPYGQPYGQQHPSPQAMTTHADTFEAPTPYTDHLHEAPTGRHPHSSEMHEMQGTIVAREMGVEPHQRSQNFGNEKFVKGGYT